MSGFTSKSHADATSVHKPGFFQATNPGAVGAGKMWIDTSGGSPPWPIYIRAADNLSWQPAGFSSFAVREVDGNPTYEGITVLMFPNGTLSSPSPGVIQYTPDSTGHEIRVNGDPLPQRSILEFIGSGVIGTDDAAGDRTIISIIGGGGSGNVLILGGETLTLGGEELTLGGP